MFKPYLLGVIFEEELRYKVSVCIKYVYTPIHHCGRLYSTQSRVSKTIGILLKIERVGLWSGTIDESSLNRLENSVKMLECRDNHMGFLAANIWILAGTFGSILMVLRVISISPSF